jgi:uncharacterized membrane protein HdeD (DUF308 family)
MVFVLMANATIAILVGIVFLFVPEQTLATIGFAAGIVILLSGLFLVFGSFSYAKKGQNMFFWLIEGLINLSLGIILIVNPSWLVEFLLILIGLWALVLGIYQLYSGFVNSSKIKNSALLKINGVAAAVIGLILLFKPGMVASFVVQLLGVISILIGGIMMYFAILIKNASKVEEAVIVKETTKEESQAEGETLSEEAAEEK